MSVTLLARQSFEIEADVRITRVGDTRQVPAEAESMNNVSGIRYEFIKLVQSLTLASILMADGPLMA